MTRAVARPRPPEIVLEPDRIAALRSALHPYRPRLRDPRFWLIQALVAFIAFVHVVIEDLHLLDAPGADNYGLVLVPISLFFVPVVYAALAYGVAGGVATASWAALLAVPNLLLFHDDPERLGEIVQLAMVMAIAVFAGQRVDRELDARRRAEAAGAALRVYAAHVLSAQEEERKRVAQELHDETLQRVVLVCRQLDLAETHDLPPTARDALHDARETAEAAVAELRDFARALRPPSLEDLGLISALKRLLTELAQRGCVGVSIEIPQGERRLGPELELALFRIAQEALHNVERHAHARNVWVTVSFTRTDVRLAIFDDGAGFDQRAGQDFVADGHLGLLGMRERAEMFGGTLAIQSAPRRGTLVTATLPVA